MNLQFLNSLKPSARLLAGMGVVALIVGVSFVGVARLRAELRVKASRAR